MTSDADSLRIDLSSSGTTTTVAVEGELDVHTAPSLAEAIAGALGGGVTALIIDASGLRFCDSSGIQVLVQARERAGEAGTTLTVTGVHGSVEKVLAVTGLLDLLTEG